VYLITNFEPSVKTNSFVGVSTDPVAAVAERCRPRGVSGGANESWRLELVFGPLSAVQAEASRDTWRATSRGIASRRRTGYRLFAALRSRAGPQPAIYDAQVDAAPPAPD
jgi:hypothetical protein